jgi:hypothetical protein
MSTTGSSNTMGNQTPSHASRALTSVIGGAPTQLCLPPSAWPGWKASLGTSACVEHRSSIRGRLWQGQAAMCRAKVTRARRVVGTGPWTFSTSLAKAQTHHHQIQRHLHRFRRYHRHQPHACNLSGRQYTTRCGSTTPKSPSRCCHCAGGPSRHEDGSKTGHWRPATGPSRLRKPCSPS